MKERIREKLAFLNSSSPGGTPFLSLSLSFSLPFLCFLLPFWFSLPQILDVERGAIASADRHYYYYERNCYYFVTKPRPLFFTSTRAFSGAAARGEHEHWDYARPSALTTRYGSRAGTDVEAPPAGLGGELIGGRHGEKPDPSAPHAEEETYAHTYDPPPVGCFACSLGSVTISDDSDEGGGGQVYWAECEEGSNMVSKPTPKSAAPTEPERHPIDASTSIRPVPDLLAPPPAVLPVALRLSTRHRPAASIIL